MVVVPSEVLTHALVAGHRPVLVQLLGATKRSVHFHRVVKKRVVDFVLSRLFLEGDERLEPVTPQDFRRKVAGAGLGGHPRGLDHALWNNGLSRVVPQSQSRT